MPSRNHSVYTGICLDDHHICACEHSSYQSISNTQSSSEFASTQDDITLEEVVVHSNAIEGRTEMEELEHRLDEMMRERIQQVIQLQAMRDGFNEQAPMLGNRFLPAATTALKFIGIAYWAFFVVRFICMADMSLLICLLGSVSLICLTFAFTTEQYVFFWPFAFVALLETLSSILQFCSLTLLIYRSGSEIDAFMKEVMNQEDLFGNSLLDEMQTWSGVMMVVAYVVLKTLVFPIAFMVCAQVARIFRDKEEVLHAQEFNMDLHHQRMTELIHRLEYLRRAQRMPPRVD